MLKMDIAMAHDLVRKIMNISAAGLRYVALDMEPSTRRGRGDLRVGTPVCSVAVY